MMLRIAVACISFGVIDRWYSGGSVVGMLVSLVVVGLLWDSRANAYFLSARWAPTGRTRDGGPHRCAVAALPLASEATPATG